MSKNNTKTLQGLQRALSEAAARGALHTEGEEPTGAELYAQLECVGNKRATERALKAAFSAATPIKL